MPDDGHRIDGVDRGGAHTGGPGTVAPSDAHRVADGTSADDGAPAGTEASGLAKILPFPRDWFGPIEDLVPVFPESDGVRAVSAASFWDEDAGAVHQLVESLDVRADDPNAEVAPEHAARWGRGRWVAWVGSALALVSVCAAGAIVLLSGGLHHPLLMTGAGQATGHRAQRRPTEAAKPAPTVTVVVSARPSVKTPRHRARVGAASHTFKVAAVAVESGGRASRAPSTHVATGAASDVTSVSASHLETGSASSAGAGCAESPDSGCMP
jgi:hypothetical protein